MSKIDNIAKLFDGILEVKGYNEQQGALYIKPATDMAFDDVAGYVNTLLTMLDKSKSGIKSVNVEHQGKEYAFAPGMTLRECRDVNLEGKDKLYSKLKVYVEKADDASFSVNDVDNLRFDDEQKCVYMDIWSHQVRLNPSLLRGMLDLLPDYIAIRILERGHYFSCTQDMSQSEIIDVVFAYDNMVYAPTKEAASQVELEVFKSPAYISAREEYESLLKQYAEIDPSVEELSSARLELKGKADAIAKHLEGLVALEKKEVFERIEAEYLAQWDEIDKKRLDKAQAAYEEKQSAANSQG